MLCNSVLLTELWVANQTLQRTPESLAILAGASARAAELVVRAPEKTVNYGWQTAPGMTFPSRNKEVPREE